MLSNQPKILLRNSLKTNPVFLFVLMFLLFNHLSYAQVLINGAQVHGLPGSLIYIQTDSLLLENNALFIEDGLIQIDRDVVNNSGTILNDGTIDVNDNLINNDSIVGQTINSEFIVEDDWINNSIFLPGNSTVILDGTTQNITGSQNSNFYDLIALGAILDIKRLIGVDVTVLNQLDITNTELATDIHTLSVLNPALNAILRSNGFVSSLDDGRLNREVNTNDEYLFPVGSSLGTVRYRPIIITPTNNLNTTYGVRLANVDATSEGFDVSVLEDSLCLINPAFYHRIYGSEEADIEMYYVPNEDGEWTDMAHWQNAPQWEDMGSEINGLSSGFNTLLIQNWDDFSYPAYALAISNPYLEIGNDIEVLAGEDVTLNPIYIGQTTDNISWTPNSFLDCDDCLNVVANLNETNELILNINEGESCAISDTITIFVIPEQVFLPTGFSPNNDGVNDYFIPLNDNIKSWNLQIWNRWGELVFETDEVTRGWDGFYKGKKQEIGVYSYVAEYQLKGQTKQHLQTGNVTLIR